jgi:hypothetical protein
MKNALFVVSKLGRNGKSLENGRVIDSGDMFLVINGG